MCGRCLTGYEPETLPDEPSHACRLVQARMTLAELDERMADNARHDAMLDAQNRQRLGVPSAPAHTAAWQFVPLSDQRTVNSYILLQ